jgi:hypothetical protein
LWYKACTTTTVSCFRVQKDGRHYLACIEGKKGDYHGCKEGTFK